MQEGFKSPLKGSMGEGRKFLSESKPEESSLSFNSQMNFHRQFFLPPASAQEELDVAQMATQQQTGDYKKDAWTNVKLKKIFKAGDFITQLCVLAPGAKIEDMKGIGASNYFTTAATLGQAGGDLMTTKQMLQIGLATNQETGEVYPSRQTVLNFVVTKEILKKYGDLEVAVGKASNNPHFGQGNGCQIFIPHTAKGSEFGPYKALVEDLWYSGKQIAAISQPCTAVPGKARQSIKIEFFTVDKETGKLHHIKVKEYKVNEGSTINLWSVPTSTRVKQAITGYSGVFKKEIPGGNGEEGNRGRYSDTLFEPRIAPAVVIDGDDEIEKTADDSVKLTRRFIDG